MKRNNWLWIVGLAAAVLVVLVVIVCDKGAEDDNAAGEVENVVKDTPVVGIEEPEIIENPSSFSDYAITEYDYVDSAYDTDGKGDYNKFYANSIREFIGSTDDENVVYSPVNLQLALSMLAELTDGNSRQQILDALGVDSMENLREQASNIWKANYSDDGPVISVLANSVWLSDFVNYNEETLDTLAETYYASSFSGVMGTAEYDKALQDWLNENTGNMLSEQISQLNMEKETIVTLASTVYFRAKWECAFAESKTTKDTFYGVDGESKCDFMYSSDANEYYWGHKFMAVPKELADGGAMWFILPDEGVTVNELLQDQEAMAFVLSNGDWDNVKRATVNMSVPKFDVSSQLELKNGLKGLGITDVFDMEKSDFSALTKDTEEIEVSEALHGAKITIDEEGCIATAYTLMVATGAGISPAEEVDFVVNRPFLFVVTSDAGTPLFVGAVNNVE